MARYLDPKNDVIFKRIFGEHPDLLISFLKALVPVADGGIIKDIEYISIETPFGLISNIVVCCTDHRKNQFTVDIEMYANVAHNKRMRFSTLSHSPTLPAYSLVIFNNYLNPGDGRINFYHTYRFTCNEDRNVTLEGLVYVIIEMPKFNPESEELDKLSKMATLWLRFLNEVNENTVSVDKDLLNNKFICKAVELCEIDRFTPEQIDAYNKYRDDTNRDKVKKYK